MRVQSGREWYPRSLVGDATDRYPHEILKVAGTAHGPSAVGTTIHRVESRWLLCITMKANFIRSGTVNLRS